MIYKYIFFALICILFSCSGGKSRNIQSMPEDSKIAIETLPSFNADSAYLYTKKQVDFGPRVPGTIAHTNCATYLSNELKRFGANVIEQKTDLKLYNGEIIPAINIIGSYQPENKSRILLCAHWDTRPFADHDKNPENHHTPIDGANDGASGCAVLLEIARQIQITQPRIGIDIIFFDAEDWGAPAFEKNHKQESGYCLGSHYWATNPHVPNYSARYGILLDMVGAPDAVFYKELFSVKYAGNIVQKVWETAASLGYGRYFMREMGGGIEDDHFQIIQYRNIPCIDIIHYDPHSEKGFGSYWHTLNDNMDHISTETYKAVGETIIKVIYSEM